MAPKLPDQQKQEAVRLHAEGTPAIQVAKKFGVSARTIQAWAAEAKLDAQPQKLDELEYSPVELPNIPIKDYIEQRKREFQRLQAYKQSTELITIKLPRDEPVGISFFGDPHIDDNGCDVIKLDADLTTVEKTPNMYGVNIGDVTNNWVGRLGKLYDKQSATKDQAVELMRWFFARPIWIAHNLGNHDLWNEGAHLMREIIKGTKSDIGNPIVLEHTVRIKFQFPSGKDVTMSSRHDWAGNSQWNPVHAVSKAAQMGEAYDILVGGHKHTSGYTQVKSAFGKTSHCIQVGAYKHYDSFAEEKGFRDNQIFNNAVAIIDPARPDNNRVTVITDVQEAAGFLQYKLGIKKKMIERARCR